MNIYKITSINRLGSEFDIYLVAENIGLVFRYLQENSVCEVVDVEKIGRCTDILKGEDDEI